VEDDASLRALLQDELETEGYRVKAVATAEEAAAFLARDSVELVLSDLRLPGADGLSLVSLVRGHQPPPALLIITAFGTVQQAVAALKAGADDFLTKPIDMDHLLLTVAKLLENRSLHSEVQRYRALLAEREFHGIVASSAPMLNLFGQVRRVASAAGPVLIQGESGTGKELVARAIHRESERQQGPYLTVNCGGIPSELMESEFFGHTSGAFTGAKNSRAGLFQEAHGGTLLLDEIGEMPVALQAKLLRVLQDGRVRPVGSDREHQVDVRIIAATNRNLGQAVAEGDFREDLYYRLETFALQVPPLRERGDDLRQLANFFLARFAARRSHRIRGFSDAAMACLARYPFPGNVRELENAVERAVTFCDGALIEPSHLPARIVEYPASSAVAGHHADARAAGEYTSTATSSPGDWLITIDELQRRHVARVLAHTGGNKRQAAMILGITRRTLYRWLEEADSAT
ncbi:MAG: sigma-54 dependent transcriptional regulator, partial [Porticoccaceae bacterium]|nr:sigma-54 dependent transcriptional regulator [Porticoccaceae bacterium]